jgi:hypothetical protein
MMRKHSQAMVLIMARALWPAMLFLSCPWQLLGTIWSLRMRDGKGSRHILLYNSVRTWLVRYTIYRLTSNLPLAPFEIFVLGRSWSPYYALWSFPTSTMSANVFGKEQTGERENF